MEVGWFCDSNTGDKRFSVSSDAINSPLSTNRETRLMRNRSWTLSLSHKAEKRHLQDSHTSVWGLLGAPEEQTPPSAGGRFQGRQLYV